MCRQAGKYSPKGSTLPTQTQPPTHSGELSFTGRDRKLRSYIPADPQPSHTYTRASGPKEGHAQTVAD